MPSWFRAGLFAALFVFVTTPSPAAEKIFQDDALDDAAITLEADLKDEAGTIEKPLAKLKQEAEALLKSQDLEGAANIYVQIVTVAPKDAKSWRGLADIWLLIPATEEDDGSTRIERARTAAYIAYQRATTPEDEAASLVTLATAFTKREEWRQALNALKLALDLHETPELRTTYEGLREKYGFRVSNFSVDSDAASPRACFQFSETPAQAHRLLALCRGRGPGQAGALGRRTANLRRRAEAWRDLRYHAARRPALDGR